MELPVQNVTAFNDWKSRNGGRTPDKPPSSFVTNYEEVIRPSSLTPYASIFGTSVSVLLSIFCNLIVVSVLTSLLLQFLYCNFARFTAKRVVHNIILAIGFENHICDTHSFFFHSIRNYGEKR